MESPNAQLGASRTDARSLGAGVCGRSLLALATPATSPPLQIWIINHGARAQWSDAARSALLPDDGAIDARSGSSPGFTENKEEPMRLVSAESVDAGAMRQWPVARRGVSNGRRLIFNFHVLTRLLS